MNALVLATVAGLLAATAPLPARADGPGYIGTCHVVAVNDPTSDGVLGGANVWNGAASVAVVATAPGDSISATCWLKVNGSPEHKILDAGGPGIGFTFGEGRATFTAWVTDTVELCTHVVTGSAGFSDLCAALTTTPVCPDQACGDGGVLDQLDQLVCGTLATLAPTVDGLPTGGALYIDPTTGATRVTVGPGTVSLNCPLYDYRLGGTTVMYA
jgi:hypothetical protein